MTIAGVNFSSKYTQSQKRQNCFSAIQQIISDDELLLSYPYLSGYKNVLVQENIDITDSELVIRVLNQLIR